MNAQNSASWSCHEWLYWVDARIATTDANFWATQRQCFAQSIFPALCCLHRHGVFALDLNSLAEHATLKNLLKYSQHPVLTREENQDALQTLQTYLVHILNIRFAADIDKYHQRRHAFILALFTTPMTEQHQVAAVIPGLE